MNRLSPQMAGIRLLFCVVLALIAGFIFGVRWAASMDTSDHRRYLPPVPAFMAFEIPDPTLPASCCVADVSDYAVPVSEPTQRSASPSPRPSRKPTERAAGQVRRYIRTHHVIRGRASWHATGRSGHYAAACAPLRRAMGPGWRGEQVIIAYRDRAYVATLNDYCASKDKTVDMSDEGFLWLSRGRLSTGVLRVTVSW